MSNSARRSRNWDSSRVAGVVSLIIAAGAAMIYALLHYSIWSFGMPGSGLMPIIASVIVIVSCLWTIVAGDTGERPRFARPPLAYGAGFVALLPLAAIFGLLPALAIVAAVILCFVEGVPMLRSVIITASIAIGSWLLFERTLMVPLPHGMLGGL